nr:MBL fold metallo-hydrolase [Microbulbifer rhizosphaerae]
MVTHSHGHGDHTAGDSQFRGKPGVTLVESGAPSVREYFGFTDWPNGTATIDLGGRKLTVLPIPGHKEDSIAVYDPHTRWLLSGDTFYPGRLYIWEWDSYRASIARLVDFSKTHRISALMGTHIEMSRTQGQDYPMGSSYQPDEAGLALLPEDLLLLDATLSEIGKEPEKRVRDKFIVRPVSKIERILTWVAKRLGL